MRLPHHTEPGIRAAWAHLVTTHPHMPAGEAVALLYGDSFPALTNRLANGTWLCTACGELVCPPATDTPERSRS